MGPCATAVLSSSCSTRCRAWTCSGPVDVFYFANYVAERLGATTSPYTVEIAGRTPGPVRTAGGPRLYVERAIDDQGLRPDVLLVAGGITWMRRPGRAVRRAAAGAGRPQRRGRVDLHREPCCWPRPGCSTGDGRPPTGRWPTPWSSATPTSTWTPTGSTCSTVSGPPPGVTAGIDLALQLVRAHHGSEMAAAAARNLVVYLQRAGGQQQYSTQLAAQRSANPRMADLMAYITDHPDADLSVDALAGTVTMSERSFQRLFTARDRNQSRPVRRADPDRRCPTPPGADRSGAVGHRPPLRLRHRRDLPPRLPAPRRPDTQRVPRTLPGKHVTRHRRPPRPRPLRPLGTADVPLSRILLRAATSARVYRPAGRG